MSRCVSRSSGCRSASSPSRRHRTIEVAAARETQRGQRPQHPGREVTQAVPLAERPVRVRLVGQEVAAPQRRGARQRLLGGRVLAALHRAEADVDAVLELVRVDPHRLEVQLVAALVSDDERRGLPARSTRLEMVAYDVDRLAQVGGAAASCEGPEGLEQLLGGHRPATVADEELEDLARAVRQPLAVELGRPRCRRASGRASSLAVSSGRASAARSAGGDRSSRPAAARARRVRASARPARRCPRRRSGRRHRRAQDPRESPGRGAVASSASAVMQVRARTVSSRWQPKTSQQVSSPESVATGPRSRRAARFMPLIAPPRSARRTPDGRCSNATLPDSCPGAWLSVTAHHLSSGARDRAPSVAAELPLLWPSKPVRRAQISGAKAVDVA